MSEIYESDELTVLAWGIAGQLPAGADCLSEGDFGGPVAPGVIPVGAHAQVWRHVESRTGTGQAELMSALLADAAAVGPLSYWMGLQPPPVDAPPVIERLQDARARRQIRAMLTAVGGHLRGGVPTSDVLAGLDGLRRMVVEPGRSQESDWMHGREALAAGVADVHRRIDARRAGSSTGLSTGYPALDALLGPLEPDPILLMARPGVGKTFMALGMLEHWCRAGKRVAIFSMEMDAAQLARRLLASRHVPGRGMMRGDLTPYQIAAMEERQERLHNWDWSLNARPALRVQDLAAGVREAARRFGTPDVIIVDHVHLMRWDGGLSTNDGMAEISAGIKAITKEWGIPALCLAQLNRSVESRTDSRPKMSDVRGSGAWEQDASVIIGLHRPGASAGADMPPDMAAVAHALVLKNRYGEVGAASIVWDVRSGGYVLGQ